MHNHEDNVQIKNEDCRGNLTSSCMVYKVGTHESINYLQRYHTLFCIFEEVLASVEELMLYENRRDR